MRTTVLIAVAVLCLANVAGAAAIFGGGGIYTQNFDSIGPAGTTPPLDWITGTYNPYRNRQLLDVSPAAVNNHTLVPDNGSSSTLGRSYNYGTTGAPDRAIGHMCTTSNYGDAGLQVALFNNTGVPITQLLIEYAGEQWRKQQSSSPSKPERLRVYLSSANNGGYIYLTNLDFNAPQDTPGNTNEWALDGNLPANRAILSKLVDLAAIGYPGGAIAPSALFYITWHDWNDDATRDHALAVDDVRITAIPEPATLGLLAVGGLLALRRRRRR